MSFRRSAPPLLVLLGAAAVVLGGSGLWRALAPEAPWASVPGEVVHSGVDARALQSHRGLGPLDAWPLRLWRQRPGGAYRPVVRYRYAVGGVPYLSDRVGPRAPARGPREAAEAEAARFPEGARVRVYYRPDAPGTAALAPPEPRSPLPGGLGLALGLGCLGAGIRSLRQRPRRQRPLAWAQLWSWPPVTSRSEPVTNDESSDAM